MHKRKRGNYWEICAANYLEKKGYKILFHNWTCRWGEVDLVAEKENKLIFIEVKFRSSGKYGNPWESVNYWKLFSQAKAIKWFLAKEKIARSPLNTFWQFDVIAISKVAGRPQLRHFEAIPLPGLG